MAELRIEKPHVRLLSKSGGGYSIPPTDFEAVNQCWDQGKTIWRGQDIWGARLTIRLADIVGIVLMTRESLDAVQEDEDERARRELVSGE